MIWGRIFWLGFFKPWHKGINWSYKYSCKLLHLVVCQFLPICLLIHFSPFPALLSTVWSWLSTTLLKILCQVASSLVQPEALVGEAKVFVSLSLCDGQYLSVAGSISVSPLCWQFSLGSPGSEALGTPLPLFVLQAAGWQWLPAVVKFWGVSNPIWFWSPPSSLLTSCFYLIFATELPESSISLMG